jgi:hypothetical protein
VYVRTYIQESAMRCDADAGVRDMYIPTPNPSNPPILYGTVQYVHPISPARHGTVRATANIRTVTKGTPQRQGKSRP